MPRPGCAPGRTPGARGPLTPTSQSSSALPAPDLPPWAPLRMPLLSSCPAPPQEGRAPACLLPSVCMRPGGELGQRRAASRIPTLRLAPPRTPHGPTGRLWACYKGLCTLEDLLSSGSRLVQEMSRSLALGLHLVQATGLRPGCALLLFSPPTNKAQQSTDWRTTQRSLLLPRVCARVALQSHSCQAPIHRRGGHTVQSDVRATC